MSAIFLPVIAALLQASSFTLDKAVLNLKRVNWRRYLTVSFPLMGVLMAAAFFIRRPPVTLSLLTPTLLALLAGLILEIVITNILFYRALQHDNLTELRLWGLALKIPMILGIAYLFTDERNWATILLALVASVAVVWSHLDHARLRIHRHTAPYILWSLITYPLAIAGAKIALRSLDPIALETFRFIPVALIMFLLFHNSMKRPIGSVSWTFLLATNVLTTASGILLLYGYHSLGVIYTGLLFTLEPMLVYVFALVILGERFERKKFIGFVVVLLSIGAAQLLR